MDDLLFQLLTAITGFIHTSTSVRPPRLEGISALKDVPVISSTGTHKEIYIYIYCRYEHKQMHKCVNGRSVSCAKASGTHPITDVIHI